jgi:DDE family transposase
VSSRLEVLHEWMRQMEALLPGVRVTRVRGMALFALGMSEAGTVRLNRVAAALPLPVRVVSTERRLGRFLANAAVSVTSLWQPLMPTLLAPWEGQEVTLVFDPTPLGKRWTVLWVGIALHRRVLPLTWRLVPQQEDWPEQLGALLPALLDPIVAALPRDCQVSLLGDRGVSGPSLIDACVARGWDVVLRLNVGPKQAHRLRLARAAEAVPVGTEPDWEPECRLWDVAGMVRSGWTAAVQIFKGAGWRTGYLTVAQRSGAAERWVLFSTRPGGAARVRDYRRRARVEATFGDGKRRGWGLEQSHVRREAHLDRLLLVWHLALWWLHGLGLQVIKRGLRSRYDRTDRRDRSVVRLGWLWLHDRLQHGRCPPCPFRAAATGEVSCGHP